MKTESGIWTKLLADSSQKAISRLPSSEIRQDEKRCTYRGSPLEQARLRARLACGSLIRTVFSGAAALRLRKSEREAIFYSYSSIIRPKDLSLRLDSRALSSGGEMGEAGRGASWGHVNGALFMYYLARWYASFLSRKSGSKRHGD